MTLFPFQHVVSAPHGHNASSSQWRWPGSVRVAAILDATRATNRTGPGPRGRASGRAAVDCA